MRNIRTPQAKIVSLLLLLGLSFFLFPIPTHAENELNVLTVDGLVFVTYPAFSAIDFTYNKEAVTTITMTDEKHTDVSLTSYVFEETPSPTPSPTDTPTQTPTPILTITPTPSPTISVTPTPLLSPTPTIDVTATPTPVATVVSDDIWDKIAACESNGNWKIDTGNGYFGGLQFSEGAWQSVGGSGKPIDASREEQIEKGKKLQALRGWGVWGECAKRLSLIN